MSEVAQNIFSQLGNRARVMLGARNFVAGANDLSFKIGCNAKSVSHLRIRLDPSDTYTVEAIRVRMSKGVLTSKVLESCSDVYVDALHSTIESLTGMRTSL